MATRKTTSRARKARQSAKPTVEASEPQEIRNAVVVKVAHNAAGAADIEIVTIGDVRPAETPTILDKAAQLARANLGLGS